jgi:hypothetical protein
MGDYGKMATASKANRNTLPACRDATLMRQFIIAAAVASGLVALWAVILPLTAEPAPAQANLASPTMSKALFLCRGPRGIDRACTAALAKALTIEPADKAATHVTMRFCPASRQMLSSLDHHH